MNTKYEEDISLRKLYGDIGECLHRAKKVATTTGARIKEANRLLEALPDTAAAYTTNLKALTEVHTAAKKDAANCQKMLTSLRFRIGMSAIRGKRGFLECPRCTCRIESRMISVASQYCSYCGQKINTYNTHDSDK